MRRQVTIFEFGFFSTRERDLHFWFLVLHQKGSKILVLFTPDPEEQWLRKIEPLVAWRLDIFVLL